MEVRTPIISNTTSPCPDRLSPPLFHMRSRSPTEKRKIDIPQELLLPLWSEPSPGNRAKFQLRCRPNPSGQNTQKKTKTDKLRIEAECYWNQVELDSEDIEFPVSFKENDTWTDSLLATSPCIMRPKVNHRWMQDADKVVNQPTNAADHERQIV